MRVITVLVCVLSLMALSLSAQADTMIEDMDGDTLIDVYDWDNAAATPPDQDTNPDFVSSNSPKIEERWLEALLGLAYDDSSVNYIHRFEFADDVPDPIPHNPSFSWDYAIVKIGNAGGNADHYAFHDTNGNNVLEDLFLLNGTTPVVFTQGVSHITYFSGTPVPEPATMLLFGTGLIGLAGLRLRKKNK